MFPLQVEAFEDLLLGPFEEILTADVAEYMPYVFQILAQVCGVNAWLCAWLEG